MVSGIVHGPSVKCLCSIWMRKWASEPTWSIPNSNVANCGSKHMQDKADAAMLISFSSFVNITSKRLDRFAWNFRGRCGVITGWPGYILDQFWEKPRDAAMLMSLSAFVNISSKWLDRFAWNFQGRCGVTTGLPNYILDQFWEKLCDATMLMSLSAFVNISSKRLDQFAWNFQGRCGVTTGRPDYILDQFREKPRDDTMFNMGWGLLCLAPQLVAYIDHSLASTWIISFPVLNRLIL